MKNNIKIDQEIKKTLELLDREDPVKTDAYFRTRLNARLAERIAAKNRPLLWLRPALSLTLALLFTLNAITAFNYFGSDEESGKTRDTRISSVAESYETINYSIYNY